MNIFRKASNDNKAFLVNTPKKEQLLAAIDPDNLPQHIAIIMDGNGRWAKERHLPRPMGHRYGAEALRHIIEICDDMGIKIVTVFAFSTENWKRPTAEISFIMNLFIEYLRKELLAMHEKNVKVKAIGELDLLPERVKKEFITAMKRTADNTGLTFCLAVNYGSRKEIAHAARTLAEDVLAGKLSVAEIDENSLAERLYTADIPDPDLLIRPSGELRISNFLLWQLAYAEFYYTDILWPDFTPEELLKAILEYQKRNRRFGGI
ncbi:MAG: isoprenyl transferase [Bacillota bacterium]